MATVSFWTTQSPGLGQAIFYIYMRAVKRVRTSREMDVRTCHWRNGLRGEYGEASSGVQRLSIFGLRGGPLRPSSSGPSSCSKDICHGSNRSMSSQRLWDLKKRPFY